MIDTAENEDDAMKELRTKPVIIKTSGKTIRMPTLDKFVDACIEIMYRSQDEPKPRF